MSLILDEKSLLADVDGNAALADVETRLTSAGYTLGIEFNEAHGKKTIAAWLAEGAKGARDSFADPADHLVAGLTGTLKNGRRMVVRAEPRRAVGPDFVTLLVGMNDRFGTIVRATLRVHPINKKRAETTAFNFERNPKVTPEEERLLARIGEELIKGAP